jgi:hypothetical protein
MCTVTWTSPTPGGRTLLCNRDEQRSRPDARPPEILDLGGARIVAPIDPKAGGTWLLANEMGFAATLLNFYDATPPAGNRPAEGYRSRGLLLLSLGVCRHATEADAMIREAITAAAYAPFWIVALTDRDEVRRWRWDGEALSSQHVGREVLPVTTSSWQTSEVLAERAKLFQEHPTSEAAELEVFHQSCSTKGGPWGPCMARTDARTVSFSRVDIRPDEVRFCYRPRAIDDGAGFESPVEVRLPRQSRNER